jgi:hypothetical protein
MATQIAKRQIRSDILERTQLNDDVYLRDLTPIDDTDSPYTVLTTDEVLLVDTTTAAVTVNLPAIAGLPDGMKLVIKDSGGNAATNSITVDPNASETIDGSTTPIVLSTAYDLITLVKVSTGWLRFDSDGTSSIEEITLGLGADAFDYSMEVKTSPVAIVDSTIATPLTLGVDAFDYSMETKTSPVAIVDSTIATPLTLGVDAAPYSIVAKTASVDMVSGTMDSPIALGSVAATSTYTVVP